ncbi:MAG: DUF4276 family protein [Betaproteobacteria bacterium]
MRRVLILVEGDNEERIVKDVLVPHLLDRGVVLQVTKVTTGRPIGAAPFKGGGDYTKIRGDLRRLLGDSNAVAVTTWFDFYGFPRNLPCAPGELQRIEAIERRIHASLGDLPRLFPYLQRHETEALLFIDPALTARVALQASTASRIEAHRHGFASVEDINLDPQGAPSKRLQSVLGNYAKPQLAPTVVQRLGVPRVREACRRWALWVGWLESLGHAEVGSASRPPWWTEPGAI